MPKLEHSDATNEKSSFSSRYTIEFKLGTGGMGVVYKAVDNVLNKPVAVKVLLPNSQADAVIRFHQEAKMTARLSHANILTVLDFGQNQAGDLYLVMDFLDGQSLHEMLKERGGSLPLQEGLGLFLQICSGLQHAHNQGVLHRDIKPSNIMLVKDDRNSLQVKIVDFGLAKVEGAEQSLTTTGMHVGSPIYMSPEQAQTEAVDHRSDIYSLGCLMYKTLTGKAPLLGETFLVTLSMHVREVPKSINDVNPNLQFSTELADIIAKTLEKNPDDRFQTCENLAEALISLDLSFLSPASPVVPVLEDRIDLHQPLESDNKKRNIFLFRYMLIVSVVVLLICIFVTGKALVALFDTPPPTGPVKIRDLTSDTLTIDILTDKLTCQSDGSLSANNDFDDSDMPQLMRFKDVQGRLSLAESQITGKALVDLPNMKKLVELNLDDTKIDDASLEYMGRIKKLKALSMNRDRIGDHGVEFVCEAKKLEELRIERTLITDLGLEAIPRLERLRFLDISGCKGVTGVGLNSLTKMSSLRALQVVQCPNISKADLKRFHEQNSRCFVVAEGVLKALPKKSSPAEERNKAIEEAKEGSKERVGRDIYAKFMEYKVDMENPTFFKFFQDKNCWKPRKKYSDIQNPRIVKCLQDKRLLEMMKDPNNAQLWRAKQTWEKLQQIEDRMNAYLPPVDYGQK